MPLRAIFGKNAEDDNDLFQPPSPSPDAIPKLTTQFFSSEFFRLFCIQCTPLFSCCAGVLFRRLISAFPDPIIIPAEFCQRYIDYLNGRSGALTIAGQLVAMLLVVWAASFGVDEYGIDNTQHGVRLNLRERKQTTNEMVRDLLTLFDIHGVMRKPTWDGVRAVLLLLPLTEGRSPLYYTHQSFELTRRRSNIEVQSPMERMVSPHLPQP